ncbi:MAG TPA: cation:proton antiporter [Chloroflexota bacterium]|jgi:NhaP-type Na+/H+ or K+/H+ antiporter|nr:cation:proton antiporter [Chloroflexota bacterium]
MLLWITLVAVVLLGAALTSGIVDRAPLSYPMVFLSLGLVLGGGALGTIAVGPRAPALDALSTVSLSLVLFLDAVTLDVNELRHEWRVPALALGPVTILTLLGVAAVAHLLLALSWLESLLLGAALASTDPIVVRDVVRDEGIPRPVRNALTIEAAMNDIVVLPVVLILIAVRQASLHGFLAWLDFLARLLLLSPIVGLVVGGVGAWLMGRADARFSIRREYQAMYGLGLVLAAYAVAQIVGGDGFLAAFFAGLAVNIFDVTLCDCFLDYGTVTAEMAMLLTFLLFGAALSTLLGTVPLLPVLGLAAITIVLIRPFAIVIVFLRATLSNTARAFIGWFGPRGLSSLLLILLVVQAGLPEGNRLLAITGMVVLVSVIAHGITATPFSQWYGRRVARAKRMLPEEREGSAAGLFRAEADAVPRISPDELATRLAGPRPPIVLDVRRRAEYDADAGQVPGSVRVLPDQIEAWAGKADRARAVVAYCT